MKKRLKTMIAGILALAVVVTAIPAQTVSAKAAAMSEKDFYYTSYGEEMCFMDMDDDMSGRISFLTSKTEKTYRGIKVGSKLSAVKSKYGSATKQKFSTKDSFDKYIKQYYPRYGISISKWKSYVEYTYKKGTKADRRLRFYLDKNDKVTATVYILSLIHI